MAYADPTDPRARTARLKHYHANKDQYLERNRVRAATLAALLVELKSHPCLDCGLSFPSYCMDFDHRDGTTKVKDVGRMVRDGSRAKILAEVAKCDLVCAICHRMRTHHRTQAEVAGRSPKAPSIAFDSLGSCL